jgi:hypothetical protein
VKPSLGLTITHMLQERGLAFSVAGVEPRPSMGRVEGRPSMAAPEKAKTRIPHDERCG